MNQTVLSWLMAVQDDAKPQQPPDENFAIAQDAIRGQHMPLPDSGPSLNKEPSEISDLGNHGYGSRKLGDYFLDTSDDDLPFEAPLQDKLLAEHHKFHDGRKGFIPRGHIEKVINEEAVANNLYECLLSIPCRERDTVIQRYVKHIFRQGPDKKSYVNVFATLVLTEKSDCIGHFLSEGIDDSALPFQKFNRKPQGQVPQLELRPRRGEKRIRAFDRWSLVKKIAFEEWQWAVNAPFFHRGTDKEARIFSLQDPAILPFVKLNPVSGNQEIEEHHGGFGKVSKRYIHADHHDLKGSGVSKELHGHSPVYVANIILRKRTWRLLLRNSIQRTMMNSRPSSTCWPSLAKPITPISCRS
jgi:hypothetical protein